jgi:hypothetical protein
MLPPGPAVGAKPNQPAVDVPAKILDFGVTRCGYGDDLIHQRLQLGTGNYELKKLGGISNQELRIKKMRSHSFVIHNS